MHACQQIFTTILQNNIDAYRHPSYDKCQHDPGVAHNLPALVIFPPATLEPKARFAYNGALFIQRR